MNPETALKFICSWRFLRAEISATFCKAEGRWACRGLSKSEASSWALSTTSTHWAHQSFTKTSNRKTSCSRRTTKLSSSLIWEFRIFKISRKLWRRSSLSKAALYTDPQNKTEANTPQKWTSGLSDASCFSAQLATSHGIRRLRRRKKCSRMRLRWVVP